jgi:hypothetical protein
MSNGPTLKPPKDEHRWIFTCCLVTLAMMCAAWIFVKRSSTQGSDLGGLLSIMAGFLILDILALLGLGVWILRPPIPGASHFLGRWAGKTLLFLGLGLATIIFLFATCYAVVA